MSPPAEKGERVTMGSSDMHPESYRPGPIEEHRHDRGRPVGPAHVVESVSTRANDATDRPESQLSSLGAPLGSGEGALDLFAVPDIRTPVPVAPGSESSREAAESITDPMRARSHRLIMRVLTLKPGTPVSREHIAEYTEIKESTLCARLSELRPLWVEAVSRACVSSSGVRVDGYRLTDAGTRRVRGAA